MNQNQLKQLNKPELIEYILNSHENYKENLKLAVKLDAAVAEIAIISTTLIKMEQCNTELKSTLLMSKTVNDQLLKRIEHLEHNVHAQAQYSRCECKEIAGIPVEIEFGKGVPRFNRNSNETIVNC